MTLGAVGNLSAARQGVKPPAHNSQRASAGPRNGSPRQHRSVCVPPFEIIGLCGIALFFAALMFGARQTPVR